MFPNFCGSMGLLGWLVMLLVWGGLIALVVWGIALLFPDRPSPDHHGSGDSYRSLRGGMHTEPEPSATTPPQPRLREDASPRIESGRR